MPAAHKENRTGEPPRPPEPRRVREMFGGIARRYDLLNHLLSANLDRRWRRKAAAELPTEPVPARVLDICGGTGDLTLALARRSPESLVLCCDFALPMLRIAAEKFRRRRSRATCVPLAGDGLRLPFADAALDAVTVGFGVRNFGDLDAGLRELARVLRPEGRLVVLEFSRPTAPLLAAAYRFYLGRILPRVGDRVSGSCGPYGYLARTIAGIPEPATLAGRIREAGFSACGWQTLSGGIVAIHTALR